MKPETDDFLRVLGSNLRAGRLQRGMTLLQLAACSGYDREELSSLEDGAHDLRFESALSLCRALNLELPAVCGRFFQEQPEKKPFSEADLLPIFAANVRRVLSQKGLRQAALQARVGLDPSTVSKLLNGRLKNPRMTTLYRIARSVECELENLMRRREA